MLREHIVEQLDHDPHFTWRGDSVTRVENLSDIVFAIALGMLVAARSAMTTYDDLLNHLLDIVPVVAGFAIMLLIWNAHFVYFRRYGVVDKKIIFLNACLLLLVLFIAYPLRFIFDSLFAFILMVAGYPDRIVAMGVQYTESGEILAIFSVGYACTFFILMKMYEHALKNSQTLKLTTAEQTITRQSIWLFRAQIFSAFLVFVAGLFTQMNGFAGIFFCLNWPMSFLIMKTIKSPTFNKTQD